MTAKAFDINITFMIALILYKYATTYKLQLLKL